MLHAIIMGLTTLAQLAMLLLRNATQKMRRAIRTVKASLPENQTAAGEKSAEEENTLS
ncbi:MAG: hypothetical protein IJ412_02210 [Oscillospiraceae bacterium]|nr:hypothetical protein [Oscillospiraceae bacterium]